MKVRKIFKSIYLKKLSLCVHHNFTSPAHAVGSATAFGSATVFACAAVRPRAQHVSSYLPERCCFCERLREGHCKRR